MKKLFLFLLLTTALPAQRNYDPRRTMGNIASASQGHYGTFTITTIPKICLHPHSLFGVKTCRVHVTYPKGIVVTNPVFFIEDWTSDGDHSKSEDTIYHVALYNPSSQGVFIEGRPGHKIWWQVNSR